tara:strand:- start:257 stop:634 length:378 start_codon:yes stop_codon:yes gene_type:complete
MKKLLLIIVLGLLLSSNAFAGWFDKDKIKVTNCYDPSKFNNYKSSKKIDIKNGFTKWEWELNLKEKIAYHITEKNGQLGIDKSPIKIVTDDYIIATNTIINKDFQFDLNNEAYLFLGTTFICKFK